MTSTDRTMTLRIPADLHEWLVKYAADNERSINKQVVIELRKVKAEQKEAAAGDKPA